MKTHLVLNIETPKKNASKRKRADVLRQAQDRKPRPYISLVIVFFILIPQLSYAQNLKGWDYLYYLMQEEGVETKELREIFSNNKMPRWTHIPFKPKPREPSNIYKRLNTAKNRNNALEFYKKYKSYFDKAELRYGVPSSIVLAIIQIESGCGRNTGNKRVFYRLARLSAIAEIKNVKKTIEQAKKKDRNVNPGEYMARAHWLQDTFLPHLIATIKFAKQLGKHPLDVRGSYSGAVGLPQFLPGNVLKYGVDGNRDGKIDIYDARDAIPSTAHFLMAHGWKRGVKWRKQRKVIRGYNNSDPYIDTVMDMAKDLRREM